MHTYILIGRPCGGDGRPVLSLDSSFRVSAICSHCGVDLFELMLADLVNLFGFTKTDAVQKAIDFVIVAL